MSNSSAVGKHLKEPDHPVHSTVLFEVLLMLKLIMHLVRRASIRARETAWKKKINNLGLKRLDSNPKEKTQIIMNSHFVLRTFIAVLLGKMWAIFR